MQVPRGVTGECELLARHHPRFSITPLHLYRAELPHHLHHLLKRFATVTRMSQRHFEDVTSMGQHIHHQHERLLSKMHMLMRLRHCHAHQALAATRGGVFIGLMSRGINPLTDLDITLTQHHLHRPLIEASKLGTKTKLQDVFNRM